MGLSSLCGTVVVGEVLSGSELIVWDGSCR